MGGRNIERVPSTRLGSWEGVSCSMHKEGRERIRRITGSKMKGKGKFVPTPKVKFDADIRGRGVLDASMDKWGFIPCRWESYGRGRVSATPRFARRRVEGGCRRGKRCRISPRGCAKE